MLGLIPRFIVESFGMLQRWNYADSKAMAAEESLSEGAKLIMSGIGS